LCAQEEDIFAYESTEFSENMTKQFADNNIPASIILDLIKSIGGIQIIQENFFLKTNVLTTRSLLGLSMFTPRIQFRPKKWSVIGNLFYTYTHRLYFTESSDRFDSYLALSKESLLNALENAIKKLHMFAVNFEFNPTTIFGLFAKMGIEERKVGFMFDIRRTWDQGDFRILFPFYYLERNYYLNDKDKKKLEKEFGATNEQEQSNFQRKHLVSDKIGFGDTDLEYLCQVFKNRFTAIWMGPSVIVPTAFRVFNGFYGSLFPTPSNFPTVDTELLFSLIEDQSLSNQKKAYEMLTNLATEALDRLSSNVLDAYLGNGGHFAVGLLWESKIGLDQFFKKFWAHKIDIDSRFSVYYPFPAYEERFYINKVNLALFEARDFNDDSQAEANLAFLTDQLIQRYFLRAFRTRVQPGVVMRSFSELTFKSRYWHWQLGSEFWLQLGEKLQHPQDPTAYDVNVWKAKVPLAYQSTLSAGATYLMKGHLDHWYIGLNGEWTFSNHGVGQHWGLSFFIKTDF
jgi:hypothetical protein